MDIIELYINALLAQADHIAANFRVVKQQETTDNGFSATVFQRIGGEECYYFAMRGTDDIIFSESADGEDNVQNIKTGMSYYQVVEMLNFYLKLTHNDSVPQFAFWRRDHHCQLELCQQESTRAV